MDILVPEFSNRVTKGIENLAAELKEMADRTRKRKLPPRRWKAAPEPHDEGIAAWQNRPAHP